MTVLHTGSNNKFSANWGNIFGKGKKTEAKPAAAAKPAAKGKKKSAAKAAAKKPAGKKKGKR